MEKIYEEYKGNNALKDLAEKYIKGKLVQLKQVDVSAEDVEELWDIVDSYIEDIYKEYNPDSSKSSSGLLTILKRECENLIDKLKDVISKEPKSQDSANVRNEETSDSARELYNEIVNKLLKNNLNNNNLDVSKLDAESFLSSQDSVDEAYQIRLNQYLYSIGICDEQFVVENADPDNNNDDNNLMSEEENYSNLVFKEESRSDDQKEEFLLDKMQKTIDFFIPVNKEGGTEEFVSPPVIFFEAFDSPMASQAEKDLEKLLAIDVFVNHLPEESIKENAALAILRSAHSAFNYIHDLKCHVFITRCETLIQTFKK